MRSKMDSFHFLVGNFDSRLVLSGVQLRLDAQAGLSSGCSNQVDDRLVTDQRPSLPVQTDEGEHAVLNFVPLAGSRGIVTHGHFQTHLVDELLQMVFPGSVPGSVTPSAVGTQQQTPGPRV